MSTNFYAKIKPLTFDEDETSEFRIHLGKTCSNTVIINGSFFPSVKAMFESLRHMNRGGQSQILSVEDEYGNVLAVADLEELFYSYNKEERSKSFYESRNQSHLYIDSEGFTIHPGGFN